MKRWLYTAVLCLSTPVFASTQTLNKIAIVNISGIFQQSPQRSIAAKQLENEFKDRASKLQSQERDLQIKIQRLQRDSSTMKASERNELERLIISQRENFTKKAQDFEQDSHRRQTEERNKLLSRIQNAIKTVSIKEGYNLVFDTNAIAYIENIKDITASVLQQVK